MSITENKERIGSFTSSEIHKLMTNGRGVHGFGAPALTYIKDKRIEKRLGRSLSVDVSSRAITWGNFMERRVFEMMGLEYKLKSQDTVLHPTIKGWSGSPDLIANDKIGEIKCYQPKHFSLYADALMSKDTEVLKKEAAAEYWQIVSNCIINNKSKGEGILYIPFQSELEVIRDVAMNYDGGEFDPWDIRFIYEGADADLPYIPDFGYYQNLITFEFDVPQADKEALTERVELAIELLNK